MDSTTGACDMKRAAIVSTLAALCVGGCAALPDANGLPSPGSLTPTTRVARQGSVYFVSASEAWELTQPPDQLHTVILQTLDGGAHWRIWGISPEAASPVSFTATVVVLSSPTHLLRSSDGKSWNVKPLPAGYGAPI